MKLGRSKSCSSSSNSPLSWISRFKKMSVNSESKQPQTRGKTVNKVPSTWQSWSEGRFHGCDDEDYWRLSFGEDRIFEDEKKIQIGLKSVWYDSDEEFDFPLSNSNCTNRRKISEFPQIKSINSKENNLEYEKQRKSVYVNTGLSRNRAKQSIKSKSCSVKTSANIECNVREPETKKKPKPKQKPKIKKVANERTSPKTKTAFDSFAVVKTSLDPEQDFVDSMVEMITVKKIQQPHELEELLACYLHLNHHKHHDLIISVFRQVWLDLKIKCENVVYSSASHI